LTCAAHVLNNDGILYTRRTITMDSWENGRRELLEGIAKIYDKIGANVDTGKIGNLTIN